MKVVKRPIEMEAWQYTADAAQWDSQAESDLYEAINTEERAALQRKMGVANAHLLYIERSKVWMTLVVGMWIIAERDGDGYYPCTEAEYEATYAPAWVVEAREAAVESQVRDILEEVKADAVANSGHLTPRSILSLQAAIGLLGG